MDKKEIFDAYLDKKEFYNFEGEHGMKCLEQLCKDLGYEGDGFRFGTSIESFLQDNSGAIEAIIEWQKDAISKEQIEMLKESANLNDK